MKQLLLAFGVAFGAVTVCTAHDAGGCHLWDDRYKSAIENATIGLGQSEAQLTRHLIESSMWNWKDSKDYQAVRKLAGGLTLNPKSMVRLEVGNANAGAYDVLLLTETDTGVWMISNMRGRLETEVVSDETWEQLLSVFNDADVWCLGSGADTGLDDGSTYFLSVCHGESAVQFAIYGLPLGSRIAPGQKKFAEQFSRQRTVIRFLLSTLEEATPDQRK